MREGIAKDGYALSRMRARRVGRSRAGRGNHPAVPPVGAQDVAAAAEHAQVAFVVRAALAADDVVDVRCIERQ
jgi:hypothetical protein